MKNQLISFISFLAAIFHSELYAQQQPKWDDTSKNKWNNEFELVEITSSVDSARQKAYLYPTKSRESQPLIVVLHTWSGDYTQKDPLADEIQVRGYNYIHPDFRGPNNNPSATASKLVISDIEDAVRYAVKNTNTDPENVHIVGTSGGGMATLLAYMNVTYPVKSFSAWAPISDLEAWYWESVGRRQKYATDILKSVSNDSVFDAAEALRRSPLVQKFPKDLRKGSKLFIYEGVHDGYTGSVPVTHAINMYNRLVGELKYGFSRLPAIMEKAAGDPDLVPEQEIISLVTKRYNPLHDKRQNIDDRPIYLYREYGDISLTIFEGSHEQLPGALSLVPVD
ncbi:MAG: prolyl oligopeptidase family serine peptidase [Mangrovibacterium sp.]|nr:prolyl oligopeptidase family serine peptidase [Mangrovibacterium sp.]